MDAKHASNRTKQSTGGVILFCFFLRIQSYVVSYFHSCSKWHLSMLFKHTILLIRVCHLHVFSYSLHYPSLTLLSIHHSLLFHEKVHNSNMNIYIAIMFQLQNEFILNIVELGNVSLNYRQAHCKNCVSRLGENGLLGGRDTESTILEIFTDFFFYWHFSAQVGRQECEEGHHPNTGRREGRDQNDEEKAPDKFSALRILGTSLHYTNLHLTFDVLRIATIRNDMW